MLHFNRMGLAAVLMLGTASLAYAEDKSGTNATAMAEGAAGAVAELTMAQDLYDYGVANSDALSVLAAARIAASVTTEDGEREMDQAPIEGADTAEDGQGVDGPADADMMFAMAMELAGGDPSIEGLIEDAKAEGTRGRVGGATRTLSRLPAGYRDTFTVPFWGGELAEVAILGDGDADLDVRVIDENGNTICLETGWSDQIYCSFTPAWTGNFRVIVDNMGRIRNSYYILTN
ncbi:MAG: hypothetical protein AAGP08_06770 [Pseudomonadota bacterium]